MSQKTVGDFFSTLKTDSALQEQVRSSSIANDNPQEAVRIIPENILRIACNNGYKFNEEDLQSYIQQEGSSNNLRIDEFSTGELSEEELEGVAGGLPIILVAVVVGFILGRL
jgi:predicted ribosomally synthesized peptide with nif11-like leader